MLFAYDREKRDRSQLEMTRLSLYAAWASGGAQIGRPEPREDGQVIEMIPAKQLIAEVVSSLRNVIAPAVTEPFQKSQAYMAAVVLEFVARQVDERADIAKEKQAALHALFHDLMRLPEAKSLGAPNAETEAALCELIERLYQNRQAMGEEAFGIANRRIRQALRQLLDQELKIAGKAED